MTGTAMATGSASEARDAAQSDSALRVAAADKATSEKAPAEKAEARVEAKAEARTADKPAEKADAKPAAKAPEQKAASKPSTGSAAGAASGKTAAQTRDSSSNPDKHGTATSGPLTQPQPLSKADKNGTGANPGETCTHSYCSTRDGSASGNGNGAGDAKGKPCAGCVGKADNKNPKGQYPDGSDANNGYECDGNNGIGKTNPAHTGCKATTTPTTDPTSKPTTKPTTKPTRKPTSKPTAQPTRGPNGPGTATMTIAADCRTVVVTSSKDISHVVVFFKDGTSTKFDGLTGKTWTRTFSKDVASARGKSATTTVTAVATGCGVLPTTGPTPPATCPDGSTMPAGGAKNCPRDNGADKLTICHATGSATNPYVVITISKAGVVNGHYGDDHQGGRDIIPAFTYKGVSYPAQGNPALIGTGCVTTGGGGGGGSTDACPNMPGDQAPGTVCEIGGGGGGGATTDACPDMPGIQVMGPCTGGGGIVDVCPDMPGNQPAGTVCTTPITGQPPAQPATNPVPVGPPTNVPPAVVPNNAVPPTVIGGPAALPAARPVQARAVPSTLPFTGTDAALLAELGVLLLVVGVGVTAVARRERLARAA